MVVVCFFLLPSLLPAAGNINFGNLKIIPKIEGQALYDDNIYMKNGNDTPTDRTNKKVSDLIYHVKPGLLLNYDLPERGSARLGWNGDWAFYNTESSNNWKNNFFNVGLDYMAPAGLILSINDEFRLKEDPFGGPNQYALGRVTKRWDNDLKAKAGVAWGNNTFRTLFLYNLYRQQYVSNFDFTQNYTNSEYGVSAEARFLPRTWGFVRYLYGVRNFDSFYGAQMDGVFFAGIPDDRKGDSKYHQANLGVSWDPGAKLSGEVSFGYMWKRYDNAFDAFGRTRDNRDTWVAATNIDFEATATTVLSLNIARTVRDIGSDSRIYFDDSAVGLNLRQTILTKFIAKAGVIMGFNEYNAAQALPPGASALDTVRFNAAEKRSDRNYIADLGLDYNIRDWLTFGVGYRYNRKTSNYEVFEYMDNQYMATLRLIY